MGLPRDYLRLNRIVERFLEVKTLEGRTSGRACAGDILRYCRTEEIVIPSERPIFWLNIRIADTINNGANGFHLEEVEGWGHGINFKWEMKT